MTLTLEPLRFGGEEYVVAPPVVPAEVVVQRAASGDLFRLHFSAALAGPCMRCLAPAELVVAVDAQEYEATDAAGDEELGSEYVADGELDVGSWARDTAAETWPAAARMLMSPKNRDKSESLVLAGVGGCQGNRPATPSEGLSNAPANHRHPSRHDKSGDYWGQLTGSAFHRGIYSSPASRGRITNPA